MSAVARLPMLAAGHVDEPHGGRDMWTAAIDTPTHGAAVECYGATEQQARALRDGLLALAASGVAATACRIADVGFRWDGEAQHHVPSVLIEFDPVPANSPCDAKGWKDRDALVALLATPSQPVAADAPAEVVHCERNDAFKSALMATGRVANFDPRGRPRAAPVEVHGATEPVLMEHDERAAIFLEEIGFEPRDLQSVNESELHRIAMRIEARVLAKNSPVAQTLASRPAPAAEAEPVEWKGLPSGEVFDMGCEVMKFLKERGAPYFYSYRMAAILHGDPEAKLYTRPAAPLSEADAVLRAAEAWADSKPDSMRACRTLVDAVIAYQAVIAALRPTPSNERR